MPKIRKPNFIIIGAMKAATTSLYTYLKQHPDIFMSSIKEPKFFNNLEKDPDLQLYAKGMRKINTFKEYYSLVENAKHETVIGEASVSYLFDENCAKLIKKYLPDTKIIAILRQPVDRAYSNFLHAKKADKEEIQFFEQAFEEAERKKKKDQPIKYYKEKGYYTEQLKRYYNLFPKENIKVLLFEEITNHPVATSQKIFEFLNIDSNFVPDTSTKVNVSGSPKGFFGWIIMKLRYYNLIPDVQFSKYLPKFIIKIIFNSAYKKAKPLSVALRKRLTEQFYKEEILNLEKLIGKNLSHWRL